VTAGPRVLIVDDHQLFRAGVRAELEGLVDIAGDAASVDDAAREIAALRPDVVLLDLSMPRLDGIDAIAGMLDRSPHSRIGRAVRVRGGRQGRGGARPRRARLPREGLRHGDDPRDGARGRRVPRFTTAAS
jgi:CheY-like chemotaxis protein